VADDAAARPRPARVRLRAALHVHGAAPRAGVPRLPPEEVEQHEDDPEHEQDDADGGHVQPAQRPRHRPCEDRAEGDHHDSDHDTHARSVPEPHGTETYGRRASRMNVPGTFDGSFRHELCPGYSSSWRTTSPARAIADTI